MQRKFNHYLDRFLKYLLEDPKPQKFCHRLKMALYSKF